MLPEGLTGGLDKTASAYAAVDLKKIAELERDAAALAGEMPETRATLADKRLASLVQDFGVVAEFVGGQMIRLNRFNLGEDPVATIDGVLRERLNGMLTR